MIPALQVFLFPAAQFIVPVVGAMAVFPGERIQIP
jgi:hypothetical protein